MGNPIEELKHLTCAGFYGHPASIKGMIELPMMLRTWLKMILFLVIDIYSSYNIIFGRPDIYKFGVIPSSNYHILKFPT